MLKKYQIVKWKKWNGIWFIKLTKEKNGGLAYIIDWSLCLGFIEIRKWNKRGTKI